jgi:hypothetical protein
MPRITRPVIEETAVKIVNNEDLHRDAGFTEPKRFRLEPDQGDDRPRDRRRRARREGVAARRGKAQAVSSICAQREEQR